MGSLFREIFLHNRRYRLFNDKPKKILIFNLKKYRIGRNILKIRKAVKWEWIIKILLYW